MPHSKNPPTDRPAPTRFAYPKKWNSCDLKFSSKGKKLAAAMREYAEPRLLPKLQARTAGSSWSNRYDAVDVEFMDACVYLQAWLGHGDVGGIAEFPFARLYPVKGGCYNVSVRRLIDWSRAEEEPIYAVADMFWLLAPNAKHWVKVATHKTFEESIDLLVKDPNF